MKRLFNSRGQHIANESGGRLYAPAGGNVGRQIDGAGIFVDLNGRYLGEVVYGDRLLSDQSSGYRATNFGNAGTTGSIGNAGDPGSHGAIGVPGGYEDIAPDRLR
ncbi:hypothetical protein tb265_40570 [Gemmatimonadetes bacterium T265]|nr:hypothetical protein tb265_39690 [Gemmatimonadetes bacterium T265]GJG88876.1 hypothetical protein tb265_40570 [Gemmatimonadetes bacterium T265]